MVRSPCCDSINLKKGPWTQEEDEKLVDYINRHGYAKWKTLPKLAGLNRCGKSCRLRWTNYLRPDIKRGKFSEEEERIIVNLHSVLGNKWSRIALHLPGRTDNEIKNFWNTQIRKKLLQMGIDPNTHKPRTNLNRFMNFSQLLGASIFGNVISPWENVPKLLADATQLAKIQLLQNLLQIMNTSTIPNIGSTCPLGSGNLNPFEGQLKGTNTLYPKEQILASQDLCSSHVTPQAPTEFQAITNSSASCEGRFRPEVLNTTNSLIGFYDIQTENRLPELVSASTSQETSIVNQMESIANPSNNSPGLPTSTIFDAWEKLLDDETSDFYWKDILE